MTRAPHGFFADVVFEGVAKSYGSNEVLRSFSGRFQGRRLCALVGPNGVGKTTLLRIAAGLQRPDRGSVLGDRVLYYGGFDTLPVRGTVNSFRRALGLGGVAVGDRRLNTLSRGQLHGVGLAAALDLAPPCLLLDEPWTALEPDAREELNRHLAALVARGHAVACSTHDLDEVARIADDVVLLRAGEAIWRRREDEDNARFDREAILQLYREAKA